MLSRRTFLLAGAGGPPRPERFSAQPASSKVAL